MTGRRDKLTDIASWGQCACGLLLTIALATTATADTLGDAIATDYDATLEDLFIHFHQNPELSFLESATANRMASELRALGYDVTEGVGGTGVVAVLANGDGPTVLLRADMDGLPVEEKSGLPYASTAHQVDITGEEQPVMHACGHDVPYHRPGRRRATAESTHRPVVRHAGADRSACGRTGFRSPGNAGGRAVRAISEAQLRAGFSRCCAVSVPGKLHFR